MGLLVIKCCESGALLAYYFLEAEESDCAIDQQIGLQSMAQGLAVLMEHFRESICANVPGHTENIHIFVYKQSELKLHLDAGIIQVQHHNTASERHSCLLNEALQQSLLC